MTAQSIACGTCGASVPYGRLSCSSCGELLASVAGARRTAVAAAETKSRKRARVPNVLYEPAAAPSASLVDGDMAMDQGSWDDDAPLHAQSDAQSAIEVDEDLDGADDDAGLGSLLLDDDEAPDDGLAAGQPTTTAGHAWAVKGASLTGPTTPAYMPRPRYRQAPARPAEADIDEPLPVSAAAELPAPAFEAAAMPAPAMPTPAMAAPTWPAPTMAAPQIPAPTMPASQMPVQAMAAQMPVQAMAAQAPGAYVPPLPVAALPSGPAGPARAWAGQGNGTRAADESKQDHDVAKAFVSDPSRVAEFVGSVSVAGAALAAVGFLLPWASVVIGSPGVGYFDRWGLAGPAHVVVVVAILVVLALAVVRNPIPTWIRTGIGGLGVGALLLGLTWPYLLGPLDAAPGVLIDAIGAIALIASGILALVTDRHAEVDQPV
jgi:hypothetical protein